MVSIAQQTHSPGLPQETLPQFLHLCSYKHQYVRTFILPPVKRKISGYISNPECRSRNWGWIFCIWSPEYHCWTLFFLLMFWNKSIYLELNITFQTKWSKNIWKVWIQKSDNFDSIWIVHSFAIFHLPNHSRKAHTIIFITISASTKSFYFVRKAPHVTRPKGLSVQT